MNVGPKVCATPISVMGIFSLRNGVFLMVITYSYKINPIGRWGKILVTVMGFAHNFGLGQLDCRMAVKIKQCVVLMGVRTFVIIPRKEQWPP